jgi:aldehyde:ferredoxin oxidoreductase
MTGGYMGKLLRVDLTAGRCVKAPLPDDAVLRKYVGGIGLGMRILMDETTPKVKATDPEAPIMFMTGPLTGTSAPSSSNLAIVCLNYDTPYAVATGHSHGYWAAYLKHAGYDGVIVTGKAKKPVYLWIDDDKVEIRDAAKVWGKDTRETERLIKRELGDEEKISVACIGPAGEAMLHGASVKNDRNHGAHKGSVGAVMGSKHLKAIAVRGTGQVMAASLGSIPMSARRTWSAARTTPTPNGARATPTSSPSERPRLGPSRPRNRTIAASPAPMTARSTQASSPASPRACAAAARTSRARPPWSASMNPTRRSP